MEKTIYFLKEQASEATRITAKYNGVEAIYQSVGDRAKRC